MCGAVGHQMRFMEHFGFDTPIDKRSSIICQKGFHLSIEKKKKSKCYNLYSSLRGEAHPLSSILGNRNFETDFEKLDELIEGVLCLESNHGVSFLIS